MSPWRKLGIPIVAIVDTNCDPDDRLHHPGNDDAIRAVSSFLLHRQCRAGRPSGRAVEDSTVDNESGADEEAEADDLMPEPAEATV